MNPPREKKTEYSTNELIDFIELRDRVETDDFPGPRLESLCELAEENSWQDIVVTIDRKVKERNA
jgi:hypothetical protein